MTLKVTHFSGRTYIITATSTTLEDFKTELGNETAGFMQPDNLLLVTIGIIKESTIEAIELPAEEL